MEGEDTLLALMRGRRSIRRYLDRPVPREVLLRLLEAARWAPSAQPPAVAFAVLKTRAAGSLAAAMGDASAPT